MEDPLFDSIRERTKKRQARKTGRKRDFFRKDPTSHGALKNLEVSCLLLS